MQDLLQLAQDIAQGCHYLEENHFIHRLETILTLETLGPLVPSEHPSLYTTWCLMTTLSAQHSATKAAAASDCQSPIRGKIETLLFLKSLKQHKLLVPVIIVR